MSLSEEKYIKIGRILKQYLRDNYLPKIAYLSNSLPNEFEGQYLIQDFNYICFCVNNYFQMSQVLFLRHFVGYRKIPFDVRVSTPEVCIHYRQFSYVCLECEDKSAIYNIVKHISINKRNINRRYDVLLRIICKADKLNDMKLSKNSVTVEERLADNDIILRVKR